MRLKSSRAEATIQPPPNTAPVKALVFVEFQPEVATTLRSLTAFDTLLALQRSGFRVEHDRESIARFLPRGLCRSKEIEACVVRFDQ
jgi:hypothetical protein